MGQLPAAVDAFKQAFSTLDGSGAMTEAVIESILNLARAGCGGRQHRRESSYRLYLDRCQIRYGDENPETLEAMRALAEKLSIAPTHGPRHVSCLPRALQQSIRLLGSQETDDEDTRSAQDCGMMPTTAPATARQARSSVRRLRFTPPPLRTPEPCLQKSLV